MNYVDFIIIACAVGVAIIGSFIGMRKLGRMMYSLGFASLISILTFKSVVNGLSTHEWYAHLLTLNNVTTSVVTFIIYLVALYLGLSIFLFIIGKLLIALEAKSAIRVFGTIFGAISGAALVTVLLVVLTQCGVSVPQGALFDISIF